MKTKIYIDNRMIDNSNVYKIIKDVIKDDDGRIIKYTIYVDVSYLYSIILPSKTKSDWSLSIQKASNILFMYSRDKNNDEIVSVIFGQDIDKMCYVIDNPIYITIDKDNKSIIVSLKRFPSADYTVIFDEMDIVDENVNDKSELKENPTDMQE